MSLPTDWKGSASWRRGDKGPRSDNNRHTSGPASGADSGQAVRPEQAAGPQDLLHQLQDNQRCWLHQLRVLRQGEENA